MTDTEWAEFAQEMAGRWPRWNPSGVEKGDWQDRLQGLNLDWLRAATKAVREQYSSDAPRLRWVLEAFEVIRRRESVGMTKPTKVSLADQNRQGWLDMLTRVDSQVLAFAHGYCVMQHPAPSGNQSSDPNDWDSDLIQAVGSLLGLSTMRDKDGHPIHPLARKIVENGTQAAYGQAKGAGR